MATRKPSNRPLTPSRPSASFLTPYPDALDEQTRRDYEMCSDTSSTADEIKLARAMTAAALRTANSPEARKWIQEVFNGARILAKSEALESARSEVLTVLFKAADEVRLARSATPVAPPLLPPGASSEPKRRLRPPTSKRKRSVPETSS